MPTTRSSTSKSTLYADASTSFDILDDSLITSTSVDVPNLKTLLLSIQANQKTIEAINSRLTEHSTSLETTSKTLTTLDTTLQAVYTTVTNLPKTFDFKIETVQQDFRSNLSTAMNSLGNKFYKDLSAHHIEMTECFKNYATTMADFSTDIINLNKNLSTLQEATLSKLDIERIVVEKWQDELDPHIQSHYEFKQETTTKLETLDQTIQDTIDGQLRTHPLLQSSTLTSRSPAARSSGITGFHQPISKDLSVFKLQKELKEIKLFGDLLKDIETFYFLGCYPTSLYESMPN
jgi:predicted  nucleic acid-binding Zn-ribbon protein